MVKYLLIHFPTSQNHISFPLNCKLVTDVCACVGKMGALFLKQQETGIEEKYVFIRNIREYMQLRMYNKHLE